MFAFSHLDAFRLRELISGVHSVSKRVRVAASRLIKHIYAYLCTKAAHLEAVTELSSEAFLATLDRLVSRRGICHTIVTNSGTKFVGARKQLK